MMGYNAKCSNSNFLISKNNTFEIFICEPMKQFSCTQIRYTFTSDEQNINVIFTENLQKFFLHQTLKCCVFFYHQRMKYNKISLFHYLTTRSRILNQTYFSNLDLYSLAPQWNIYRVRRGRLQGIIHTWAKLFVLAALFCIRKYSSKQKKSNNCIFCILAARLGGLFII